MIKRRLLFFLFLFIFINGYSQENAVEQKPVSMDSLFRKKELEFIGKAFPEFNTKFNGRTITKDSLKGKVVFINFWFKACPPCIAELDALNELYRKFSVYKDFVFLSFTFEKPSDIPLLRKHYKMRYPVASVDRQECYRLNFGNGFPTSAILDRQGVVRYFVTGGDHTDKKEARDIVIKRLYPGLTAELKN
ncbi:MAG: TlpA disulfide reductase family protein [Ferruginibacter sp.]